MVSVLYDEVNVVGVEEWIYLDMLEVLPYFPKSWLFTGQLLRNG